MISTSLYRIARTFLDVAEVAGHVNNPQILAFLQTDETWPTADEVPWCSAFMNYVCKLVDLPRSRSLSARSWLRIGIPIELADARPDGDIVILKRGEGAQPGPEVINAPGHVGLYAGRDGDKVLLLGGNQGDKVSIAAFPASRVLGVRRLEQGII